MVGGLEMKRELKPAEIENLRGYIKVIEAFIQGKQIQCSPFDDSHWYDVAMPTFDFQNANYRIKPEVKELYYCVYQTKSGAVFVTQPRSKEEFDSDVNTIVNDMIGVILEERKITVISEYE
jgi:hypothetical protein